MIVESSVTNIVEAMGKQAAMKTVAMKSGSSKAVVKTAPMKALKKLTQDALKAHQALLKAGATDQDDAIAKFNALDANSKMSVWKLFELHRKASGSDGQWVQETGKGTGSSMKKVQLMAGFILDKGNIGNNYKSFTQKICVTRAKEYESEWISLQKALNVWGKKELHARVQSGSILMRKNPKDPRFPEFKEETVKDKVLVENNRELAVGGQSSSSVNEMLGFFNADTSNASWEDFTMNNDADDDDDVNQKNMMKLLGIKDGAKKGKGGDDQTHDDDQKLETATQVGRDDTSDDLAEKFEVMKKCVIKYEKFLKAVPAAQLNDKTSKQMGLILQSLGKSSTSLTSGISSKAKVSKVQAKSMLLTALAAVKKAKEFKTNLDGSSGGSSGSKKK